MAQSAKLLYDRGTFLDMRTWIGGAVPNICREYGVVDCTPWARQIAAMSTTD